MTLFTLLAVFLLLSLCYYNRMLNPFNILEIQFGATLRTSNNDAMPVFFDDRYAIRTPGCIIERTDPWDPSFKRYFRKLATPKCPQKASDILVYQTEDGYLKVDKKSKKILVDYNSKRKKISEFICKKREVFRNKIENKDHTAYWVSDNVTEFKEWTLMDVEYAQIKCYVDDSLVYHNYFFSIIKKPEVEAECEVNYKNFLTDNPQCVGHPQLSVLLIGIDSLSKANFLRQMPMTFDYVANNLQAIDMLGYNKVGLNTFPSLMPYLTGNNTDELAHGCWGGGGVKTFDNCTFLWDNFSQAGYRTAFVENLDDFGLFIFNKGGNHRQVAHYYGHTIYIPVLKHAMKSGCWRGIADDEHVIDWAYQFQKQFVNESHYGHFWMSRFAHDDLNTAQHIDPILLNSLRKMNSQNMLNNTLLIFMSDHGIRFGDFRETEVGRQEENLPFMYLAFPRWFQKNYPHVIQKIRENRHRLFTTFDLHETLKSIISCDYINTKTDTDDQEEQPVRERGVPLFKLISRNRTCDDAGIPAIYCGCKENLIEMDTGSKQANQMAELLTKDLNRITGHVRTICVHFELKTILSFKQVVQLPDDPNKKKPTVRNTHIISIMVKPGDAKFEATIQLLTKNNTYIVNNDIRRINRYGDTSYCISNDGFLKSVCYCGLSLIHI